MKWVRATQELPPERRYVLVQIDADDARGDSSGVAVGYVRWTGAGEPYFVVPGARRGFVVSWWSDSLGDDFNAPLWRGKQGNRGHPAAVRVPILGWVDATEAARLSGPA